MIKVGSRVRISREDFEAWLEQWNLERSIQGYGINKRTKWQFLSELKAAFSITPIPIVSLIVCRVIKESVKAKVKGDNNYEQ